MVRQAHLIALVGTLLIAVVVVGCGGGAPGKADGRNDERGDGGRGTAATTNEETTAPEGDRPASGAARKRGGLDAEAVSPGQAYMPVGFSEGFLWATDLLVCNDTGSASASSAASVAASCAGPNKTLLKRLDPRTGEEVAAIPLKGFFANIPEVAFGAGSVWISSGDYYPEPVSRRHPGDGPVLRVDPETERVVDRIPVDSPTGLAFGHGSVWAASAAYGTVSRIDPKTGEVAAVIEVGRGAVDIATDEGSGDVWVAGLYLAEDFSGDPSHENSEYNKLSRMDPVTNRMVAEIPIVAHARYGGAQSVAVGEGAVWAQGGGKLFKVDPTTNKVVARLSLGDYSSHLAVYGGAVWATVQVSSRPRASYGPLATRLVRVDPRTGQVSLPKTSGPWARPATGGWLGAGDTCGSRMGTGWLGSRLETPVPAPSVVTLRPVPSCSPFEGPSVVANF